MAKPKASETGTEPKQEPTSEANPEGKVQEPVSEVDKVKAQERVKLTEEIKTGLLGDKEFMKSVVASEGVQSLIQHERDTQVHQQTLPMKQQMEEMERKLAVATKANDPIRAKYQKLKDAGEYEQALELLENSQQVSEAETAAEERGRRKGAQEILSALSAKPPFQEITQEEWNEIYAAAAAEAGKQGRSYITVEEYVSHATNKLLEKGKATMTQQTEEERRKEISEEVTAELKKHGIKRREEDGGPEGPDGEIPGGDGDYTMEQLDKMSRAELAKVPRAKRHKAMAAGSK
ncbi:hypothetical protein LCGC14_2732140 [marine sediment metagenome]|uniref:Uncharacterized protein n=1 Tax=marine sediment metagenome TaxID=412755 RepID=A0A0F8Z703_9ZZZZ